MRLEYSDKIKPDLANISAFIAKNNPENAAAFIKEIRQTIMKVAADPMIYAFHPAFSSDVRSAKVGNYLILFTIDNGRVHLWRITQGQVDLNRLQLY